MQFLIEREDQLVEVANYLVSEFKEYPVWLFKGEMGAGKTTLIKVVCERLKVIDLVNSPTFSIVNEYLTEKEETIYHFDFYRIENEKEAVDIGTDEYFYSGDLCLIEWSEKIPSLIPAKNTEISIILQDNLQRLISVESHD